MVLGDNRNNVLVRRERWQAFRNPDRPEWQTKADGMMDWLSLAMLICAGIASLVFGVLTAYGILYAAFAWMRPHPRAEAAKTGANMAQAS